MQGLLTMRAIAAGPIESPGARIPDDIASASESTQRHKLSPLKLVRACLSRISALPPTVNAFITVTAEQAIEEARAADRDLDSGNWRGPLHGIPVAIKDFYDTAGARTTAAYAHFKNRVPSKDAVAVAKLRSAGAIIVGKTNMHTLGTGTTGLESCFGPVRNPWNARYVPGGLSSGSAVAVASGMCYATLDSDAVGSCRLPAACCGVVGFKGTYGLISMQGILDGEQLPDEYLLWMAHARITSRRVCDTALMLDVLAERGSATGPPAFAATLDESRKLRLGIGANCKPPPAGAGIFEAALKTLRSLGHEIIETEVPLVELDSATVARIKDDRRDIRARVFKHIDAYVLPATPTTTPTVGECRKNALSLSPAYTPFANYYGLPAISVPCGFHPLVSPVGLQFVAPADRDALVLQVAHQYESATSWTHYRPPQ
ncbi:MAG TPA: amidase [Burkholderiaceae bacterium]|nr:amidase [Burkholderiaceae bacterium]